MKPSDLGYNLLMGVNVTIGSGVTFGANVVVYDDTVIGDGCFVQDNAVLGKVPSLSPSSTAQRGELPALVLGAGSVVCTGAIVYRGVTLGERCIIGDLASVRERCVLGERVVVGRGTCVENDTRIGAFTKIQSNAYITAYMEIEDHVFVAPTVQTNDNFMGRTERRHALEKGATIRPRRSRRRRLPAAPGRRDRRRGLRRGRLRRHPRRATPQAGDGLAGQGAPRRPRRRAAREPVTA